MMLGTLSNQRGCFALRKLSYSGVQKHPQINLPKPNNIIIPIIQKWFIEILKKQFHN